MRPSLRSAGFAVALALGAAGVAVAAGRAGDDRPAAEAALKALLAVPAHSALAREPIARAQAALHRAEEARAAGDTFHGAELEALGREWADTGTDLSRAAESERAADDLEQKVTDVEGKTVRARALLEDTVARRGRAEEALHRLEQEKGRLAAPPADASAAGKGKPQKGKKDAPAPPVAPKDPE